MKSDLILDAFKFSPLAVSDDKERFNAKLIEGSKHKPKFSRDTLENIRAASHLAIVTLPQGQDVRIPSREKGRNIPCRAFNPEKEEPITGILLHVHGGGYALNSEKSSDRILQRYANVTGHVAISVGYRLAPENPFPAAIDDCVDVGVHLVRHGREIFGTDLQIIAGDSVGASLSLLTTIHLLRTFPSLTIKALVLAYGDFAPSGLPATYNLRSTPFLDRDFRSEYLTCYLPGRDVSGLQQPDVAPMYENLDEFRGKLPKVLFICGSRDPLLDDSVMMCVKWLQAGAEGILRVVPGGFHRFIAFPPEEVAVAREGWDDIMEFLAEVQSRS